MPAVFRLLFIMSRFRPAAFLIACGMLAGEALIAFAIFALLSPVFAQDTVAAVSTTTQLPLGAWIAALLPVLTSGLPALIVSVFGYLAAKYLRIQIDAATRASIQALAAHYLDAAIGSIATASKDKVMTIDTSNALVAKAVQLFVVNEPKLATWALAKFNAAIAGEMAKLPSVPDSFSHPVTGDGTPPAPAANPPQPAAAP